MFCAQWGSRGKDVVCQSLDMVPAREAEMPTEPDFHQHSPSSEPDFMKSIYSDFKRGTTFDTELVQHGLGVAFNH